MNTIVTLDTTRTHYSPKEAALRSLTVAELRSYLDQFDDDTPVIFCNDNGYTYGEIKHYCIGEIEVDEPQLEYITIDEE